MVDSVILAEGPTEPAFEALTYITYSVPACNPSNLCLWRSLETSYDLFCELISIDRTYFSTKFEGSGGFHSVSM